MEHTTAETTRRHAAAPTILSADTITGDDVVNARDEELGNIKDLMVDMQSGKIRYVVMSSGGFLGMGDRLFAVPWGALKCDSQNKRFILDVDAERLKAAPGFDKDHWPNMADTTWATGVDSYYGFRPDATKS
jgi:sporulation protein YlmC with PRC-barrel domain